MTRSSSIANSSKLVIPYKPTFNNTNNEIAKKTNLQGYVRP